MKLGTRRPPRTAALTLPVVCAAQLLIVLDATIVNIALPSAQHDLGMSDASRQWAITAYLLTFGGLLLLGGRVCGALGYRRSFGIGLVGFAASSALGGVAADPGMLFAARGLQGVFAAVLAPAGLALLATTFTEEPARGRAFGVFASVGASGSAVGLILGGLLTEYASWRWCFYINVPIALMALLGTRQLPPDHSSSRQTFDVLGALLSGGGFAALVYGFSQADTHGWGSAVVVGSLAVGIGLLIVFVVSQLRTRSPLLPMRVLADRERAGALVAVALTFVAIFGFYLFMSYYSQTVLGYTPLQAGLVLIINAFAAIIGSTLIAARLNGRVAPVFLVVPALVLTAAGLFITTRLTASSAHVLIVHLTPSLLLTGLGLGCLIGATANLATTGTHRHDLGTASATYNVSMQLGAALGTSLFNTIATSATASLAATTGAPITKRALVHGYTAGLTAAFGIALAAACVAALLLWTRTPRTPRTPPQTAEASTPPDPESKGTLRMLNLTANVAVLDAALLIPLIYASRWFTNNRELVAVLGPTHGILFLALIALCTYGAHQRRWRWWFPLATLITGGPIGSLLGDQIIRRRLSAASTDHPRESSI